MKKFLDTLFKKDSIDLVMAWDVTSEGLGTGHVISHCGDIISLQL